jgi:hypothetical protein
MPSYWTDRSACMQSGLGIYGLVSSKKLDYEQKIILEVVPWSITNSVVAGLLRKAIIDQCKTSLAQKMTNSDDFAFVFSTKSIKYKFKNFKIIGCRAC